MAEARRTERRHWLFYPALTGVGMAMLASCARTSPPPPAPHAVATLPVLPTWQPPPRRRYFPVPARKPAPPPTSDQSIAGSAEPALAMAGPEAGMRPPGVAAPPPHQLIGLDQGAATRLFGAASARYEAPPATVWRYRSAACELDLYFYLDLRSGKMRTLRYAFKGGAADPGQRQDCLRSLVAAGGS